MRKQTNKKKSKQRITEREREREQLRGEDKDIHSCAYRMNSWRMVTWNCTLFYKHTHTHTKSQNNNNTEQTETTKETRVRNRQKHNSHTAIHIHKPLSVPLFYNLFRLTKGKPTLTLTSLITTPLPSPTLPPPPPPLPTHPRLHTALVAEVRMVGKEGGERDKERWGGVGWQVSILLIKTWGLLSFSPIVSFSGVTRWKPFSTKWQPKHSQSARVTVSVSAQVGIVELGKTRIRCARFVKIFHKVALGMEPRLDCSKGRPQVCVCVRARVRARACVCVVCVRVHVCVLCVCVSLRHTSVSLRRLATSKQTTPPTPTKLNFLSSVYVSAVPPQEKNRTARNSNQEGKKSASLINLILHSYLLSTFSRPRTPAATHPPALRSCEGQTNFQCVSARMRVRARARVCVCTRARVRACVRVRARLSVHSVFESVCSLQTKKEISHCLLQLKRRSISPKMDCENLGDEIHNHISTVI